MSQQINLYNRVTEPTGNEAFTSKMAMRLLGGALLIVLAVFGYLLTDCMLVEERILEGKRQLLSEQNRLDKLSTDYASKRSGMTLEQEIRKAESELAAQQDILNALKSGVIGNTSGFSEYMQAFSRQVTHGLWLTGFAIEGNGMQMTINGATLSPDLVPGYIMRLNQEDVVRGRTFASLEMQLPKEVNGKKPEGKYIEFILQSSANEGGTK